ncbi:MAG: SpoIIE family protein phosphatase [Cyanobacteria bacterium J06588_4]
MPTNNQSQLPRSMTLRQLGMSINAIIGYSEIILKEMETAKQETASLQEIEQIRDCGVQLLASLNGIFSSALNSQTEAQLITISHTRFTNELIKPTKSAIARSQRLLCHSAAETASSLDQALTILTGTNFDRELQQINRAATKLLAEINGLIEVPARVRLLDDTSPASGAMENSPLSTKNVYTILVVDDSSTNREILSKQVEAEGYRVATAGNGKQAIMMIQTGAYDLIFGIIISSKISGYQVLQWIRNSNWKHIPTIMISALEQTNSVVKCIEMGAADYLTKPFNSTLLKARLGACLEQKRLRDLESYSARQLSLANQKISQLNKRLRVENTRLSSELEVTQRLQQMLLPKEQELSQIEALEIAGFCESADEIGGDYYDVLRYQGRIIIGIGDVSGHGLESGVLMLMVQTAVRTLIESNETDPKHLFEVLNRTIYKNIQRLDSDKNVSLSLVDYFEGVLRISGQHEEILIMRQEGKIERIDTVDLGFPLGLEESIANFVFETQIKFASGEVAVLYTDGITEAENAAGEHYGLKRLCDVVQQHWRQSAQNIRQAVIQNLRSYIGSEKVYDDITLVVFKHR